MKIRIPFSGLLAFSLLLLIPLALMAGDDSDHFRVHSTTFQNGATFPLSMIFTIPSSPGGPNICTVDGTPGGNQSPELSWT